MIYYMYFVLNCNLRYEIMLQECANAHSRINTCSLPPTRSTSDDKLVALPDTSSANKFSLTFPTPSSLACWIETLVPMTESKLPRKVPMRVLSLGMGRTGTSSMQAALHILGFKHTYHGYDTFDHPEDFVHWEHHSHVLDFVPKLAEEGIQIVALEKSESSVDLSEALRRKMLQPPLCLIVGNEVAGDRHTCSLCGGSNICLSRGKSSNDFVRQCSHPFALRLTP